ncbi:hypothetical protein ACM5ME_20485 [Bacillus subtilis]|uniref:hypothetical protein n=1 Tax=Bacillus subtilis TaxID=1423 RepID=UPI003AADF328
MRYDIQKIYDDGYTTLAYQLEELLERFPNATDYVDGLVESVREAIDNAYEEGKDEGYDTGYYEGYSEGYEAGLADAS